MFSLKDKDISVGQRLGLPYIRSMQPTLDVKVNSQTLTLDQDGSGVMAISGVVWDCGLLMVDFLSQVMSTSCSCSCCTEHILPFNRVLDIGCGTGICGIAAATLGAGEVVFTDVYKASSLESNLEGFLPQATFVPYSWNDNVVPTELNTTDSSCWDCLLCSDLLYDAKHHDALLGFLKKLSFRHAVFAYKMRHDQAELRFFESLSTWCDIEVIDNEVLQYTNLSPAILRGSGLFLAVVTPKPDHV